jgi:nicotinate-nucleotide pyrophosphorylase (carboxylating)
MNISPVIYREFLKNALSEDIGKGDITTDSIFKKGTTINGRMIAKQDGVIAGVDVVLEIFYLIDPTAAVQVLVKDGDKVAKGDVIIRVSGEALSILKAERTALNFLQRMSGIATKTARCVELIKGTNCRVIDTRKTAPGLRMFDKYAVLAGGGFNHRFNLSDGVLIKDNHIAASGGIKKAVELARNNAPHTLKIEVEVENETQLEEALEAGADIIMLDNMSAEMMKKCVEITAGRALLEASGNIDENNISETARTGVDFISMGSLTHSVKAFDISLKFS